MIYEILSYIGNELNKADILWGVGASILLNQYGLSASPHDIDILVALRDVEKADKVLRSLGERVKSGASASYATKHFYEYIIRGYEIDLMGGLTLNHTLGSYEHCFDEKSIVEIRNINGVDIPFTSLEDWYIIYMLIRGRENKVDAIEVFLMKNGVKHMELLNRTFSRNLPQYVIDRAKDLIEYREL